MHNYLKTTLKGDFTIIHAKVNVQYGNVSKTNISDQNNFGKNYYQ